MNLSNQPCTSRNIPLPIQREVRQRCGFGCVICGLPLYEYEHMSEWAIVKRHVADEITLLCDQHHREKTSGLLPKKDVYDANSNPFNLRTGVSRPYNFHFSGTEASVNIGNNYFTCAADGYGSQFIPLMIDSVPLIAFILADGHLLLNLVIYNEFNVPVMHIKNNQLLYTTIPWDITLIGKTLTIREAHKKILVEIEFKPPNEITVTRGRLLFNGIEMLIGPKHCLITNNNTFASGNRGINTTAGFVLGHNPNAPSAMFHISELTRYLGDNKESLAFQKEVLSQINP